jgi:tRNA(Arg) A34 adenosine deaminase TadA
VLPVRRRQQVIKFDALTSPLNQPMNQHTKETMLPRWVERHIENDVLAQRSRYTTKHACVYPHVALLFQGRRLIAIGQNRAARRGPYNMIHAEADVIRNVGASRLRGATLVVIRLGPRSLLNSTPCPNCAALIEKCQREYGLRGCLHS